MISYDEFERICSPHNLIDFCHKYDIDYDYEAHEIYTEDEYNEAVASYLKNWIISMRGEEWDDIRRYLEGLPIGSEYYIYDDCYGEFYPYDFEDEKEIVRRRIEDNFGFDNGEDEEDLRVSTEQVMVFLEGDAA